MDLSLVENKVTKKDTMKILSKRKDFWSGLLGAIKAIQYTIDLKEETQSIYQEQYHAGRRSQKMSCEHVDKQLEVDVGEPAQ